MVLERLLGGEDEEERFDVDLQLTRALSRLRELLLEGRKEDTRARLLRRRDEISRMLAEGANLAGEDLEGLKDFGPFDVILDPVGGQYAALNLELLARDGRWVNIGLMGGREARLDLALVLGKRIQLIGSTLRNRDDQFKADLLHDLQQHVWPLFVEGRLKPQLVRSFALKDSEEAFETLAGNQVAGKLALLIDANLI